MKSSVLATLCLCTSILITSGCDSTSTVDSTDSKSSSHTHADGSVHSDDHPHGDGHIHGTGPHGGTLAAWGEKYHAEFTVDHDKQEATVYILGSDKKSSASIDAKEISLTIKEPSFTIALASSPLDSKVMGGSSRFVGTHEGLGVVMEYEGTMSGVVEETPYSGSFKEEPHGH